MARTSKKLDERALMDSAAARYLASIRETKERRLQFHQSTLYQQIKKAMLDSKEEFTIHDDDVNYFHERVQEKFSFPVSKEELKQFFEFGSDPDESYVDKDSVFYPKSQFLVIHYEIDGLYYHLMSGQGTSISVSNKPFPREINR